ncbi:unnamed protein product, partial [Ectocarpus sp. 12 AP-2014]
DLKHSGWAQEIIGGISPALRMRWNKGTLPHALFFSFSVRARRAGSVPTYPLAAILRCVPDVSMCVVDASNLDKTKFMLLVVVSGCPHDTAERSSPEGLSLGARRGGVFPVGRSWHRYCCTLPEQRMRHELTNEE